MRSDHHRIFLTGRDTPDCRRAQAVGRIPTLLASGLATSPESAGGQTALLPLITA